jgi:hypothetical protein
MEKRSRGFAVFGFERFGDEFAVGLLEENFDAAFGFFELLLAVAGKGDALFEKLHGLVERKLRAFEAANDLFEAREGLFEFRFLGGLGFFCAG